MHREEEIALGLVGNIGALLQILDLGRSQRLVRGARIDHLHTGHTLLDLLTQALHHLQGDILLLHTAIDSSRIVTTVAGIKHHNLHAVAIFGVCRSAHGNGQNEYQNGQNITRAHF